MATRAGSIATSRVSSALSPWHVAIGAFSEGYHSLMEGIGASLRSGAMRGIVLSDQEMLIRKHYKVAGDMVTTP